jgi:hypothetical protein
MAFLQPLHLVLETAFPHTQIPLSPENAKPALSWRIGRSAANLPHAKLPLLKSLARP